MKTQLIIVALCFFMSSLLAQSKSILQTQTRQVHGKANLINLQLDKKVQARSNLKSEKLQDILASTIAENRSRNDTFNSGHEQQPSISVADNTIACSSVDTTDFVVAAKNQRIYFISYSPNVVTSATLPLQDFSANHVSNGFIYRNDPKLIYDPVADRYMLVFFYFEIENTPPYFHKVDCKLYVLVSTTNDPLNSSWYEIEITNTDVTSSLNWFDRPQIGVSDEELFIAVNVYDKANDTYQDNLILALKKDDLLNGIKTLTVVDIQGNPPTDDLFGMAPVSHAQNKNFGTGLYFIRTDEGAILDSLSYYRIPTNVYANPNLTIYKTAIKLNNYERGNKLPQKNSVDSLEVASCRILDALYLNNQIHYVFHAKGNPNPCEVIYNRLDLSTDVNTEYRYTDFPSAYPSLASLSFDSTDQTFLIPYLTCDSASYPSFRVVACYNGGTWSNDLLIRGGDTTKYSGSWGDYIGAARLHSGSILPTCWIYGNYSSPNYDDGTESYIAEIILTNPNGIAVQNQGNLSLKVFPNPAHRYLSLDMTSKTGDIVINLWDLKGVLSKTLYQGDCEQIPQRIAIPHSLKGAYILTITDKSNQLIGYEKVIIE